MPSTRSRSSRLPLGPLLAVLPLAVGCGAHHDDASATFTESVLTLELSLSMPTPDSGAPPGAATDDAGALHDSDAGVPGAGAASPDAGATPPASLEITARDGTLPVVTDLWLYTLDGAGQMTPLTGFSSTAARKTPALMLPATIGGQPSGLAPTDDGHLNGLMTNTTRGVLDQGAFVSTVTGTVVVTFAQAPGAPILVVAGVEDQRYTGAAVINPDGTSGQVPAGVGQPETHARRSFARDVAPILAKQCAACHNPGGTDDAQLYLVTGSREDLVDDNFALKEQTEDCRTANPSDDVALAPCVQAITKAQYLVEPGAPAVSDLLQRARPDEAAGTSPQGLLWYGGKGSRYNPSYGDRRMPSTTQSPAASDWTNQPTYFDVHPADFQILFDWVAQGALP